MSSLTGGEKEKLGGKKGQIITKKGEDAGNRKHLLSPSKEITQRYKYLLHQWPSWRHVCILKRGRSLIGLTPPIPPSALGGVALPRIAPFHDSLTRGCPRTE